MTASDDRLAAAAALDELQQAAKETWDVEDGMRLSAAAHSYPALEHAQAWQAEVDELVKQQLETGEREMEHIRRTLDEISGLQAELTILRAKNEQLKQEKDVLSKTNRVLEGHVESLETALEEVDPNIDTLNDRGNVPNEWTFEGP